MSAISIIIGEIYYNKDPQSSDLGKNIITASIEMMDEMGFEQFTFKKLAEKIGSTEASIYRYFDNKLMLLLYLTTWYWAWVEYMIDFKTYHIQNTEEKLKSILRIICHADHTLESINLPGIDIGSLRNLVIRESDKTYLTRDVDEINSQGLFRGFKALCHKVALVIEEINDQYKYPHTLVSTVLEASHQQAYFAQHLPSLTEVNKNSDIPVEEQVYDFIEDSVFRLIR